MILKNDLTPVEELAARAAMAKHGGLEDCDLYGVDHNTDEIEVKDPETGYTYWINHDGLTIATTAPWQAFA